MDDDIRQRLKWVQLFEETQDVGLVCRRCGISRPTLRKWLRRYRTEGEAGLHSRSRRPQHSPRRKVTTHIEQQVLDLRKRLNIGVRRLQNELVREYGLRLGLETIHKILRKHQVTALQHPKRSRPIKRYQKAIPGERVQMNTCKIRPGLYLYTAIDDCSRYLVVTKLHKSDAPRGFNKGYQDLLEKYLVGRDVLEIGSGYGHALLSYANLVKTIIGVEVNPEQVKSLDSFISQSGLSNISVYCQAAQTLDFPDRDFDVIISNDVWEHLHPEDAKETAHRAYKLLRPGGYLIIATVNHHSGPHDISKFWLPYGAKALGHHLHEWDYAELSELLESVGLRKLRTFCFAPIHKLQTLKLLTIASKFPIPVQFKQALEQTFVMRSRFFSTVLGLQNVLIVAQK